MNNTTIQRVLELESQFESLYDCEVMLVINVPLKEMNEAAKYLQRHLYHPFESGESQNYYKFYFLSERNKQLSVEVRSSELFKRETKITEI